MNGPVKTMVEFQNGPRGESGRRKETEFDRRGNARVARYMSHGKIDGREYIEVDSLGRKIRETRWYSTGPVWTIAYIYGADGQLVANTRTLYDRTKHATRRWATETFTYTNGRMAKSVLAFADTKSSPDVTSYAYDSSGNEIESEQGGRGDLFSSRTMTTYDRQGRWVQMTTYRLCAGVSWPTQDMVLSTNAREYDAAGNVVLDSSDWSSGGYLSVYAGYRLDSHGNWTERHVDRKQCFNGKWSGDRCVERRAFTYWTR